MNGFNLSKPVSFLIDYKYAMQHYVIIYKIGKEYVEIYCVVNRYQDIWVNIQIRNILKGKMGNFIEELDERYQKERKKNKIKSENKSFVCNIPFRVSLYGKINENYLIRKGKLTRFLYIKDDCRVYFTDADILTMLLQIQNNTTMDLLIENLGRVYKKCFERYNIWISKKKYEVVGMTQIKDEQILTNPYDINISFDELFILINLILSKDQASTPLWPSRPDFLKHTTSKYISLIKYYYYRDEKARSYLLNMGYDVEKSIYSNYDTLDKRDEKRNFFCNFSEFEKNGLL